MINFIDFVKQENDKYKNEFEKRSNTVRNMKSSSNKKIGNKIKVYVPNHIKDSFKKFDDSGRNYDDDIEYFEEIFRTRHISKRSKSSIGNPNILLIFIIISV